MTTDDAIDALLQQKLQIEEQLPALLGACQTDAERATVKGAYQRAVDQWNTAVTKSLVADQNSLRTLVGQLGDIREQIQSAIKQADDLGSILNRIVGGIAVGSKIVMALR